MERDHPKSDVQEIEKTRAWGIFERDIYPIFIPQALLGLIFTVLSFYIGYYHGEFILSTINTSQTGASVSISTRLAYALCCSLPMLLSLSAGVQMTAIKRALTGAANPLSGNEHVVQVHKNYTTNTLEQFVVGLSLMLIVAAYTDNPQVLRLLPVYSFVFTVGRILFWIGYTIYPFYRTFGMSAGFMSTYFMFGMVIYYSWTNGLAAVLDYQQLLNNSQSSQIGHQEF
jgi:hypothetical protein